MDNKQKVPKLALKNKIYHNIGGYFRKKYLK
jgi:hypothetical protein